MIILVLIAVRISDHILTRRISTQISRLIRTFRRSPATGFRADYIQRRGDFYEIVRIGKGVNRMNGETRALIESIREKQQLLASAELNALRAQMRPHFIYNVLNDIKSMAKLSKTQEIVELIICFSALLRSTLSSDEEFSTVSEELDQVEKYVRMQNLRGSTPVDLEMKIDQRLHEKEIPRFLLQPLVENAIAHGLPGVEKPIIEIDGEIRGKLMVFTVRDNGCGISRMGHNKPMDGITFHAGIGLENITRRLHHYYGSEGRLEVRSQPGAFTIVTLTMGLSVKNAGISTIGADD